VDVLFATDRRAREPAAQRCNAGPPGQTANGFGGERGTGRLSFGVFPVRLPAAQRVGQTPPALQRRSCGSPQGDPVYLDGPQVRSEEQFAQSLAAALRSAASKEILVFIHGYNFAFDEAVLWAAQLKHDVHFEGVLILYSWPSSGSRWDYPGDLGSARWTTPHLTRFLQLLAVTAKGVPIHLLAHSMGNRPALAALHALAAESTDLRQPRFGQIIFAAPDVEADAFRQAVPAVLPLASRVTLYTASDLALRISGLLSAHRRAGDSDRGVVLVAGMDTVDVTAIDGSLAHHDYFLENDHVLADIFQLLSYGAPPQKRFRLFGVQVRGLTLWQFRS
jgi:esterase/lipase superfamily enzyme